MTRQLQIEQEEIRSKFTNNIEEQTKGNIPSAQGL